MVHFLPIKGGLNSEEKSEHTFFLDLFWVMHKMDF